MAMDASTGWPVDPDLRRGSRVAMLLGGASRYSPGNLPGELSRTESAPTIAGCEGSAMETPTRRPCGGIASPATKASPQQLAVDPPHPHPWSPSYDLSDSKLGLGRKGAAPDRERGCRIQTCLQDYGADLHEQRPSVPARSEADGGGSATKRRPPGGSAEVTKKIVEMAPVTPRPTPPARAKVLEAWMQSSHFKELQSSPPDTTTDGAEHHGSYRAGQAKSFGPPAAVGTVAAGVSSQRAAGSVCYGQESQQRDGRGHANRSSSIAETLHGHARDDTFENGLPRGIGHGKRRISMPDSFSLAPDLAQSPGSHGQQAPLEDVHQSPATTSSPPFQKTVGLLRRPGSHASPNEGEEWLSRGMFDAMMAAGWSPPSAEKSHTAAAGSLPGRISVPMVAWPQEENEIDGGSEEDFMDGDIDGQDGRAGLPSGSVPQLFNDTFRPLEATTPGKLSGSDPRSKANAGTTPSHYGCHVPASVAASCSRASTPGSDRRSLMDNRSVQLSATPMRGGGERMASLIATTPPPRPQARRDQQQPARLNHAQSMSPEKRARSASAGRPASMRVQSQMRALAKKELCAPGKFPSGVSRPASAGGGRGAGKSPGNSVNRSKSSSGGGSSLWNVRQQKAAAQAAMQGFAHGRAR